MAAHQHKTHLSVSSYVWQGKGRVLMMMMMMMMMMMRSVKTTCEHDSQAPTCQPHRRGFRGGCREAS